jgi:hypothetical protein
MSLLVLFSIPLSHVIYATIGLIPLRLGFIGQN